MKRLGASPAALAVCLVLAIGALLPPRASALDVRSWEVVKIEGAEVPSLRGKAISRLAAFRCGGGASCAPVPFQVDERDSSGHWVVDHGAAPTADDPPGILDDNDEILFMATDAGERVIRPPLPGGPESVVEIALGDPLGYPTRWLYMAAYVGSPPRSPMRYVSYDEGEDRIVGRKVSLGFRDGVPQFLSLEPGGPNVLDRLKARATATLLWGLLRITRGDGDLIAGPVSWHAGAIRVIRRQQHAVRIGFGIRSPRFGSDTYFYRDFAEMPVSVRLRVPPRYFFTSISVRTVLDFRGLPGAWRFSAPGLAQPVPVDCSHATSLSSPGEWFALRGGELTLVQRLTRSASLSSVRERLLYDADSQLADPPEAQRGECPGVGFVLDDWDGVDGGQHALFSTSYALPPDEDIAVFLATVDSPLRVRARAVRAAS